MLNKGNKITTTDKETHKNIPIKNTKQGRTVSSHKLEKTMEYTNDLVNLTTKDQQVRRKYYRKKLKLLKKSITVKERIATALENISNIYPVMKY